MLSGRWFVLQPIYCLQFHLQGVGEPDLQQKRIYLQEMEGIYWRARVNLQESDRGLQVQRQVSVKEGTEMVFADDDVFLAKPALL